MKLDDIGNIDITGLVGKFLVVETISDGYTGTVSGRYNYEIISNGLEVQIFPVFWNEEEKEFERTDEMVVYTEPDTVFYVAQTTRDPYNHAVIEELAVEKGMNKDKRTLQAFKLFAKDKFSFSSYNIFLTGDIELIDNEQFIQVESVTLDKQTVDMYIGDKQELTATILPEDATNKTIVFTAEPEGIVSIDANDAKATITGLSVGEAVVTATTLSGKRTAQCTFNVTKYYPVTGVSIVGAGNLQKNKDYTYKVLFTPSEATDRRVAWMSSDTKVAIVAQGDDDWARVLTVGGGKAEISVRSYDGNHTAVRKITVSADIEKILLNANSAELKIGDTFQFEGTIYPDDATNRDYQWATSNPDIVTIDEKGLATAIAEGKAQIFAKVGDNVLGTADITVVKPTTDPEPEPETGNNDKESEETV